MARPSHASFDWIDILLVFATLCGVFALAAAIGTPESSRAFQYGAAGAVIVVVVARRAIRPPRVVAVGSRKSASGFVGAACMIFGLVIASMGGSMFFDEWKRPVVPYRVDHDKIDKDYGLRALDRTCVVDGKPLRGRACRTPEEIAREKADDERMVAEQIVTLEAEKRRQMTNRATIAGVGIALVLVGIALDVLRTRRDASAR